MSQDTEKRLVYSYLGHRRVLGILGLALPVVLMVWGFAQAGWSLKLRDSISGYYHGYGEYFANGSTAGAFGATGIVFVGILFVIAFFLFSYKGYKRRDDIAGYLACVFALGVAFFPTNIPGHASTWQGTVHLASAVGLFLMLSFFSLVLFTKTKKHEASWWRRILDAFRYGSPKRGDARTPQKRWRNRVYVACGLIMLVFMILIGLYYWLGKDTVIADIKPVFWLESLMLWAFGVSWMVKGDWLWLSNDHKRRPRRSK
jgi:hypothetical protein